MPKLDDNWVDDLRNNQRKRCASILDLRLAAFERAVIDCSDAQRRQARGERLRPDEQQAIYFVFGEPLYPVEKFTFDGLCEVLGFDADRIRRELPSAYQNGAKRYRPKGAQTRPLEA